MPARRCSICAINWPLTGEYKKCPACLEETSRIGNIRAIDDDEAQSLKNHFEFDRFYEEWDENQPPERLLPDLAEVSSSDT